jgi:hypothetical protein
MHIHQQIKKAVIDFSPKIYNINMFNPNIGEHSNKVVKFKNESGDVVNIWIFSSKIIIELPLKTSLLFSINIKDNICLANKLLNNIQVIGNIYSNDSNHDSINSCIELLYKDIISLNFENNEGLTIYANALQLITNSNRDIKQLIQSAKTIKSKIEQFYPEEDDIINEYKMPEDIQEILTHYAEWIISDDFEREIKIKESESKDIEKLIDAIYPKFDVINKLLDNFREEPVPEEVNKIQSLAELVSELMVIIPPHSEKWSRKKNSGFESKVAHIENNR